MGRDDDDALGIADHDIAREDRDIAAADRPIDLDGLMQGQVGRGGRAIVIGREGQFRDLVGIAEAAIGDDAGDAALHQARDEDAAGGSRARVLAAIDHHHRPGRAILDRLALRMGAILEDGKLIQILARRDVAEREGLADHGACAGIERADILDELVAQAALEQGGAERGDGDRAQLLAGFRLETGHAFTFSVHGSRRAAGCGEVPAIRPAL